MDYWMGMILGNCFLSAEDAEGRGEWQLLFVCGGRGGTRRTATAFFPRRTRRDAENGNCFLSTEDTEEHGERQLPFFRGGREGTRRTATAFFPRRTRRDAENGNCFLSAEDAEGHGERQLLFVHGGHGGTRRTATAFFRGGRGELHLMLSESGITGLRKLIMVRGSWGWGADPGFLSRISGFADPIRIRGIDCGGEPVRLAGLDSVPRPGGGLWFRRSLFARPAGSVPRPGGEPRPQLRPSEQNPGGRV